MAVLAVVLPFVLLGVIVMFVAFSGGPGRAREVYLTRGGRGMWVVLPLLYLALGVAVPAAVIAGRGESGGATGALRTTSLTKTEQDGKHTFMHTCASCHTLAAVNARGVTGPDLDQLGQVTKARVLNAIRIGGTGQKRMPAGLLHGDDAQAVAAYVSKVAGQ